MQWGPDGERGLGVGGQGAQESECRALEEVTSQGSWAWTPAFCPVYPSVFTLPIPSSHTGLPLGSLWTPGYGKPAA